MRFKCNGCKHEFSDKITKLILSNDPFYSECPFCTYKFTQQQKASFATINSFKGLDFTVLCIDETKEIDDSIHSELRQLYNEKLIDSKRFKELYDEIMRNYKDFKAKFAENPTFVNLMELKFRLKIAKDVPTRTNYILSYNLMESIVVAKFKKSEIDIDDKVFDRFEKCKNLSLENNNNNERKVAFERALEIFQKITKIEI